jgi:hypothetical protein
MKSKAWKAAGFVAAVAGYSLYLVGVNAQQNKNNPNDPVLSTNWVGCLVFGSEERIDRIVNGAYPHTDQSIEIGLRSDGVVIWRRALR